MLPISDAKRLKLGNEATNIEKRLERSYDNDRSENEHKMDRFRAILLKKCCVPLSRPLSIIWRLPMDITCTTEDSQYSAHS